MKKRKLLALFVSFLLVFAFVACGNDAPPPQVDTNGEENGEENGLNIPTQQLSIGTAGAGGAFYPIGVGMAEIISRNVPQLFVTAEITGGAVENPRLVGDFEVDLAISNANTAIAALLGEEPYEQVFEFYGISALHASVLHIVTIPGTGVTSVEDLRGQRVSVGPVGGGAIPMIEHVFAAYGLEFDDIQPSFVSFEDGMAQLRDGHVVAAFVMAGFPAASIMALGATHEVVLIPVSEAATRTMMANAPYLSVTDLQPYVYNLDTSTLVIGVNNIVIVNPQISDDTVYAIIRTLYENLEELQTYHSALEAVTREGMYNTSGVPLHPGAERFWRSIGRL